MSQPLSYGQRRLWFMAQTEPGSPAYNIPLAMHLAGDVDRVALARALADESNRIVVLDEPTAGMDANLRDRVWRIIESRAERCVVVVATHDPQAPIRDDDPVVTLPED